jgi:uncharacterized protein (TIGR03000 family)
MGFALRHRANVPPFTGDGRRSRTASNYEEVNMRFSKWAILALAVVLVSTSSADAFGRRGRRGCNGCNGNGCHGGRVYNGCHGGGHGCHGGGHGCHGGGVIYRGGHGGCHGGHSGCHGGGVIYSGGRVYSDGGAYYGEQSERVSPPRRDPSRQENGENGDQTSILNFRAPEGAQVWVDGQLIERSGADWRWTTPTLRERRSYEVRARWNDDGRVVNQTRTINVQPGGNMTVDFTRPEVQQNVTPNTPPARPSTTPQGERQETTPNAPRPDQRPNRPND